MLKARHTALLCTRVVETTVVRTKICKGTTTKHPDLPIRHELHDLVKWRRPEKLPLWDPRRTGDLEALPEIDPNWLKVEYQAFEEKISKLPPQVAKIFTVGFGKRKDAVEVIKRKMVASVQRHKYDMDHERSIETKVAWMTFQIRNLRDRAEKRHIFHDSKGALNKQLNELTMKRRKWLNKLRHLDYRRFEWLIEALGVLFKPLPEQAQIRRRPCVDRLTGIICEEIISRKMQEYKEELEAQKIPFLESKLQILKEIKADEEAINLASSVDEDIEKTWAMLSKLRGPTDVLHPLEILEKPKGSAESAS